MQAEAESNRHSVIMEFQPGDLQFVNNTMCCMGVQPMKTTGRRAGSAI